MANILPCFFKREQIQSRSFKKNTSRRIETYSRTSNSSQYQNSILFWQQTNSILKKVIPLIQANIHTISDTDSPEITPSLEDAISAQGIT
jgi:hypothetical protein